MSRRKYRRDPRAVASDYLAWLMQERGWHLQEALTYAKHGEAERLRLAERGRPDPRHCALCERYYSDNRASPHLPAARTNIERREAINANKPSVVRAFARHDQPCPKPGCQYPINHSGPHRIAHDLREMLDNSIAALDKRER